jgi:hypothetical protein
MAQTKVVRKEWMMGYQKAGAWVRQTVHLMDMMLVGWWDLQTEAHLADLKESQTVHQLVHPTAKQMAQTKVVRKEWMMGYQKAGAWVRQTVRQTIHLMDMMLVGWKECQTEANLADLKESQTVHQLVHPTAKQLWASGQSDSIATRQCPTQTRQHILEPKTAHELIPANPSSRCTAS